MIERVIVMSEKGSVKQDSWYYETTRKTARKKVKRQRSKAHRRYGKDLTRDFAD